MKKTRIQSAGFRQLKPILAALGLSLLVACASTDDTPGASSNKGGQGSNKERQAKPQQSPIPPSINAGQPDLVCQNAGRFSGRKVGNGHCVSLIKHCTGAPLTDKWRPGQKVLGAALPAGTIIATFRGQRYPSKHGYHAAIYIEQDESGIWVWDQWRGKPVHRRLIRIRHDGADPGNTAQAYRVVRLD